MIEKLVIAALGGIFGALVVFWFTIGYQRVSQKRELQGILKGELEQNLTFLEDIRATHIFLRDDGWNMFRNRGGLVYISEELYGKLVEAYKLLSLINVEVNKERDTKLSDVNSERLNEMIQNLQSSIKVLLGDKEINEKIKWRNMILWWKI